MTVTRGLAGAALVVTLVACSRGEGAKAAPRVRPIEVVTVAPARADLVRRITLPGSAQAWEQVMVHAKVAGYLRAIHVDRGDAVQAGQAIAELELPELDEDVAQHGAAVSEAESALAIARDHESRLAAVKAAHPEAVTPAEMETAAAHRAAVEARVSLTRATHERARSLQRYASIVAPISGVVGQRYLDTGALVQAAASAPLVSLYAIDRLRVVVDVPERDAAHVSRGHRAEIHFDAVPAEVFAGRVGRFSGAVDPATRTLRVEIDLDNARREVRPGYFGRVTLDLETHTNALTVPAAALVVEKGKRSVFCVAGGVARKVGVTTGADDGVRVEIVSGLSGGEEIIVAGQGSLADGMPVVARGAGSR